MSTISATIVGASKLLKKMKAYEKKVQRNVSAALKRGGVRVHATAVKSILTGPKTGRVYVTTNTTGRGAGGKFVKKGSSVAHRASAPGEAPASDTSNLAGSLAVVVEAPLKVLVVGRAPYARALELGTDHIEPRPYLFPAVEQDRPQLIKELAEATSYEGP